MAQTFFGPLSHTITNQPRSPAPASRNPRSANCCSIVILDLHSERQPSKLFHPGQSRISSGTLTVELRPLEIYMSAHIYTLTLGLKIVKPYAEPKSLSVSLEEAPPIPAESSPYQKRLYPSPDYASHIWLQSDRSPTLSKET